MVQHALEQAGGNEQLAINLILKGEVHGAATASSSAASIVAPALSSSSRAQVQSCIQSLWLHGGSAARFFQQQGA
jgi:hypothetical protein